MTTSSEDVLMQVGQVRYKKGDGTLFIMNERIAWMLDNKHTFSVSHKYTDIKSQKISPEGKIKIQLQVVLHDGQSSTFHFINTKGIEAQIQDRDQVKDMLQQLLPKFKREIDEQLQEKKRILLENPELQQLYRDLVIPKIVTSEEFWEQHATQYTHAKMVPRQDIGVNSAFLTGIKPQADGCNGLKYNLSSDIIESIFKTYSAVKKKHTEYVPAKMSDAEFWAKFCQSHYCHRDRINLGTKDIFTECAKIDEQEMKKDIQAGIDDPLVDINSFDDVNMEELFDIGIGKSDKTSGNNIHQNMIKRFNQHSIMVMKANATNKESASKEQPQTNGSTNKSLVNNQTSIGPPTAKKQRVKEKIILEDLDTKSDVQINTDPPLVLTQVDRYLHGPVPNAENNHDTNIEQVKTVAVELMREVKKWANASYLPRQPSNLLVSTDAALFALGELSPGGALMKGFRRDSLGQAVPKDVERELASVYVSTCELLKHFWRCFPPTTPQLEEKVTRMHAALRNFHTVKLTPFEDRLQRDYSAVSQHITSHLNQLLDAAYRRFALWQQRRGGQLR
ncbi:general transcription factor IIH subunit 1 [Phymastichus coffea]|uniref:general transcription factor IIH subunit 1 n=1 Tax=Phymastichus coffea TaxID=108790 RepID=UPI00273C65A5|nr:general transcription factor IIH subunit 1 [Phymastichus coffea]